MIKNTSINLFRKDINGLRALAVIIVAIYHFFPMTLSSGFIGVDIFFVISGYVITGSIIQSHKKGNLSYLGFLKKRIARLTPALIVLLFILTALSSILLPRAELIDFYDQAWSSLLNISNIYFWQSAGYFDTSAYQKILLHTWSLSVEWQFYILFPILVITVKKYKPYLLKFLIWSFSFFSFILAVYAANKYPSASFYLLPTRAWEIGIGCSIYFFSQKFYNHKSNFFIGVLFIILGLIFISSDSSWPSWLTLLPTLGTALIILANQKNKILDSNVMQWIGDRSYSIYLYHWPLFYALAFIEEAYSIIPGIIFLFISIVLGHFSFIYVEKPFKKILLAKNKKMLLATSLTIVMAFTLHLGADKFRVVADKADLMSDARDDKLPQLNECLSNDNNGEPKLCSFGNTNGPLLGVLIGDSHATSVVDAFASAALENKNGHIIMMAKGSCPTVQGVKYRKFITSNQDVCASFNRISFEILDTLPAEAIVVIHNRSSVYLLGDNYKYAAVRGKSQQSVFINEASLQDPLAMKSDYLAAMKNTLCYLGDKRKTFVLLPVPEMELNIPLTYSRRLVMHGDKAKDVKITIDQYNDRNSEIIETIQDSAKECNVYVLDPTEILCKNGLCNSIQNGEILYYDDNHLSQSSAEYLIPLFKKAFN